MTTGNSFEKQTFHILNTLNKIFYGYSKRLSYIQWELQGSF